MSGKNKGLFSKLIGWSYISSSLIETKNLLKNNDKDKYIVETFDDALGRLGLNTDAEIYAQIKKNYDGRRISSIIMLTASILVFAQLLYNLSTSFDNIGIVSILIQILAFIALFLMSVYDSFRCYQIQVRELGGLNIFLKKIRNYIPMKSKNIDWLMNLKESE